MKPWREVSGADGVSNCGQTESDQNVTSIDGGLLSGRRVSTYLNSGVGPFSPFRAPIRYQGDSPPSRMSEMKN